VRKVALQIGVARKAGVVIGRDQECVARNSYEGIEYPCSRGTKPEECAFNIHIGRINCVIIHREFCIKVVCDGSARLSPPEVARNCANLSLKD
jgi:hypothetical protein